MKHFLQRLYLLAIGFFVLGVVNSFSQGAEDFSNLPTETSNSYLTRTWVGTDGVEWNAIGARTDQTINGKAICWGNSGDRNLITPVYSGGMGTLSFKYVRAFTGTSARSLEVYVNSTLISEITVSNTSDEVITYTKDVNLTGNVILEIRSTGAAQVKVDDIMWTGYDPTAGSLTNFALSDYTIETGQSVTFTWDAVDVDLIKFQVYDEEEGWFDLEELTSVNAALETLDFAVPTDATEGIFDMRIIDVNNSAIVSNTVQITITDVHFAGLDEDYPTYPEADQLGVPTDLFFIFDTDEGTNASYHRILLYFNEDIQRGTGNITVYNVTDGVTAFTFDVATSTNIELWGDAMALNVGDLLPEKVYRVTVPSGAIKDMASTPNVFAGTEWLFTTGSRGTYRTIAEIQQPSDLSTSDASPYVDQYVMTSGVVTYKRSPGFYLQDNTLPFSGIYVYDTNTTSAVNVGDAVTLTGQVLEYNNLTEIANVLNYQISGPTALPDPAVIILPFDKTNSEQWESMLVKVENVSYTGMVGTSTEFYVEDGSANSGIIDNYLYAYAPAADETFDYIAGIMNDYKNAYKLAPRSVDDIASGTNSVFDAEQLNLMVYPNPVVDELRIRSDENIAAVEVVNLAGQVVASKNKQSITGGEVIVSMVQNDKGVYVVKITTESGEVFMKKIVKE